jgi:hypothetical protein
MDQHVANVLFLVLSYVSIGALVCVIFCKR